MLEATDLFVELKCRRKARRSMSGLAKYGPKSYRVTMERAKRQTRTQEATKLLA